MTAVDPSRSTALSSLSEAKDLRRRTKRGVLFIEDGKYRLKKSKPLLILVIAFIFTFMLEAIELFALPFFADIFGV